MAKISESVWPKVTQKRMRSKVPKLPHPSILTAGPRDLRKRDADPYAPPPGWPGSRPEWMVYMTLITMGLNPQTDFDYQTSFLGGRQELGGMVADFVIRNPPLVINVQGGYWHNNMGVAKQATDQIQRAQMTALGYTVVYLDEQDINNNVEYYVSEALKGHDYSQGSH